MEREAALKKARNMVLRFLTYRAHSRKEVSEYLMERKGFSEEISEAVINEMERYGYINDENFARDFVLYRKMRGFGLLRVRYELAQKGIDHQLIDQVIEELFNPEDDLARIKEIIDKRVLNRRDNKDFDERWFKKEASFLKRRGFQDSLIVTALKEYDHSE
ncbi:MAG: regulatory protein RecX [Bacillota bacterium]